MLVVVTVLIVESILLGGPWTECSLVRTNVEKLTEFQAMPNKEHASTALVAWPIWSSKALAIGSLLSSGYTAPGESLRRPACR